MAESDRAIVVGASMAGLLAARALTDHFQEVVLIERDRLPEAAEFRKGVPQSRHIHVLLSRGQHLLEEFFPGFREAVLAEGAVSIEWPKDVLFLAAAGWGLRFDKGLTMISCTRELLDWSVRRRVLSSPRVRLVQEHDVVGLTAADDGGGVNGVQLRSRGDGAELHLDAGLVVDASGRTSHAPEWLSRLGYAPPRQTVINSFLGYATRQYLPPDGLEPDWRVLFLMPSAPQTDRQGVLVPIEGNRWMVTLSGAGRDYPPTEEDAFLEFARSLRSPILYEVLKRARPVSPIVAYRRTENQWRHYDELQRWPDHFVVLGDAACAFNPVYGQGMSMAGEAATVLDQWLRAGEPAASFQRRLGKKLKTPWLLATGEDFRYPTTEGGSPDIITRLTHRYLDRLLAVGTVDETVNALLNRVFHLLEPPTSLFRPSILVRAMRGPGRPLLEAPPTRTVFTERMAQPV